MNDIDGSPILCLNKKEVEIIHSFMAYDVELKDEEENKLLKKVETFLLENAVKEEKKEKLYIVTRNIDGQVCYYDGFSWVAVEYAVGSEWYDCSVYSGSLYGSLGPEKFQEWKVQIVPYE